MGVVDGEQVRIGPSRAALAGVGEILEAVEPLAVVVLVGVLHAHQVLLVETVVDLNVELIVVAET